MKNSIAALVPLIALGFAANSANAKDPALLSLTMEHFRDTATVKDDPVDAITTISTENGYAEHTGPMRMVWNDEYLTSAIDKKTGQKSFQVYAWTIYSGRLRSYESVNYQTPTGPKSVPAIQIGKETANCAVGDCLYTERVAFPVDEDLLRQLAAGNVPGKPTIWAYKFIAKTGPDYAGGLSSAEIAGIAEGSATRRKAPQRVQPSISAACSIEGSMPSKKPFISHEKKQIWTAMCGSSSPI